MGGLHALSISRDDPTELSDLYCIQGGCSFPFLHGYEADLTSLESEGIQKGCSFDVHYNQIAVIYEQSSLCQYRKQRKQIILKGGNSKFVC